MSRTDILVSKSRHRTDCRRSTNLNLVSVVLDREVADFIDEADTELDDLSYDVAECIYAWTRYQYDDVSDEAIRRLSEEFYLLKVAKSRYDSDVLATLAIRQLFPRISALLKEVDYEIAAIYSISLRTNTSHRIRCTVTFTVP